MTTSLEDITLEEFKAGNASVEKTLLVVSGLSTEDAVEQYVAKLDKLEKNFKRNNSMKKGNYALAKALFDYLGETKYDRYNLDCLLANVIDNQLSEDSNQTVGDCVGLTSLYTVLGQRIGLDLSVFKSMKHILNCMTENHKEIFIENIQRFGFDIVYPKNDFKKEKLSALVAVTLNSRGLDKYNNAQYQGAIRDYDRAIELNPDYETAFNNRGIAKEKMGEYAGAIEDYDRAIELEPNYTAAFHNRGGANNQVGDYAGAIRDYDRVIELRPHFEVAFNNRGVAKEKMGEYARAIEDYRKAIDLKPNCVHAIKNLERLIRKTNALDEIISLQAYLVE